MTDPLASLNAALADHYVIDRELGHGGMAFVYLARDLKHERFVALKTLRPEIALALGRDRFLREIKLAARLQHPNILGVYDSGDAGGTLYFVMPFVEGESLRDRLVREPQLPLDEVLQIAREVADALSYAHSHDVVHRDIKPENIMMSGGHAIVTDFGIARAITAAGGDKLTETGLAIGTPAYMSPEQAAGMGHVDRRSDIYSLACVVYETLAGQPPFTGPTAQAIMARHSLDSVPRLKIVRETIPDALDTVLKRALAKVPADRYQTAQQFADAMATASTGIVSPATMVVRPTRPGRLPRRWPVVTAVTVALLGGVSWVVFGRSGTASPAASGGLDPRHIAVLYFEDLSPDSSLGYLADGVTEGLIDELGAVRALRVVSPNGVASFRRSELPRDSIARSLHVGTLVQGSVEPVGTRLRVAVRLVDGSSGVDLQRENIESPAGDYLAIRDSVVARAAVVLRAHLGEEIRLREQRAGTRSVEAWTLVQRAQLARKEAEARLAADDRPAANKLFAEADTLLVAAQAADEQWIEPIVSQARIALILARRERELRGADKFLQAGLSHAERAWRKDPHNPDVLEIRGTLRYQRLLLGLEPDRDAAERLLAAAEGDLRTATTLNPQQAGAWSVLSHLYYRRFDRVEANRAARSAYEADAYLARADEILWRLYSTSYDLELWTQAADWCDKGFRRFPKQPRYTECQLWLMTSNAKEPGPALAWHLAESVVAMTPQSQHDYNRLRMHTIVAAVLARAGLRDSARHVLERSRGNADVDPSRSLLGFQAFASTVLGDKDEALRLLSEYLIANPSHREGFARQVHWWWRSLQDDPRFQALIR